MLFFIKLNIEGVARLWVLGIVCVRARLCMWVRQQTYVHYGFLACVQNQGTHCTECFCEQCESQHLPSLPGSTTVASV